MNIATESVRNFENHVNDPLLKRQIKAFVGQEANHGKECDTVTEHVTALEREFIDAVGPAYLRSARPPKAERIAQWRYRSLLPLLNRLHGTVSGLARHHALVDGHRVVWLEGGKLSGVKLAYNGLSPFPARAPKLEAVLEGKSPADVKAADLDAVIASSFTARDGLRATWAYRALVARNLALEFIEEQKEVA